MNNGMERKGIDQIRLKEHLKGASIFIFLFMLSCLSVQAQTTTKLKYVINAGTVIPISSYTFDNFSDNREPGISVGVGIAYLFTPHSSFQLRYGYTRFGYEANTFNLNQQSEEGIYTSSNLKQIMTLKGLYKLNLFPNRPVATPYLIAGGGAIRLTDRSKAFMISQNGSISAESFYNYWEAVFAFGAGFTFKTHQHWKLNFGARFDIVANKYNPVEFIPVKIGIEF